MAQVSVVIAGRTYRMACNDGEEAHLENLAKNVDTRIDELRVNFGEIGDQRLIIMAALTLADHLNEMQRRNQMLTSEVALRAQEREKTDSEHDHQFNSLMEALEGASTRLENITQNFKRIGLVMG